MSQFKPKFKGYYKASLIGGDLKHMVNTVEFTGDWNTKLPQIVCVNKKRTKLRRYVMNFYLIDIAGNRYEPIKREINKAITMSEMCSEIGKMIDELAELQSYAIDFYKSYVVVRA